MHLVKPVVRRGARVSLHHGVQLTRRDEAPETGVAIAGLGADIDQCVVTDHKAKGRPAVHGKAGELHRSVSPFAVFPALIAALI